MKTIYVKALELLAAVLVAGAKALLSRLAKYNLFLARQVAKGLMDEIEALTVKR